MSERLHIEKKPGAELPPNTPVVGIFGQIASGKDTAAEILQQEFNFAHFTYSGVLENLLEAKGLQGPFTREKRWEMRRELIKDRGTGAHTQLLWERVLEHNSSQDQPIAGVILNGPRPIEEARALIKLPNSTLVGISCPTEVRYQRLASRQRPEESSLEEDFRSLDLIESAEMREMFESAVADIVIINEGTSDELKKILVDFVKQRYFSD